MEISGCEVHMVYAMYLVSFRESRMCQVESGECLYDQPPIKTLNPVLISYCFCSKLSQLQWLKTMQTYSLIVLKVRILKSRYWQVCVLSRCFGGECVLTFVGFQRSLAFLGSYYSTVLLHSFQLPSFIVISPSDPLICLPLVKTNVITLDSFG